jgi:hypothetical protein
MRQKHAVRVRDALQCCSAIAAIGAVALGNAQPARAAVTRIVVDSTAPAFGGVPIGAAGAYTLITGRAFGELDPTDPHNAIITDIDKAPKDSTGQVSYIATFQMAVPQNLSAANGLLIYDVTNRGGNAIPSASSIVPGAIYLQSGWQGDLLAHCTTAYPCTSLQTPYTAGNQVIEVPVATNKDGSSITGPVYGHIAGASGSTAQMVIFSAPVPYKPVSLDTSPTITTFYSLAKQTITGVNGPKRPIPAKDWAWADCSTVPFPGTPDPTRICLKNGFDPSLLYEMVFTAKDPLVLGVGYAATRDIITFFHHARADRSGTANPVAGAINTVIDVGVSQSAAFLRSGTHLGFNESEGGGRVADGLWSQIDGRQLYLNVRFALPDVITNLYMMADEGPVWWADYPNVVRHQPLSGLLDRCTATKTCPEILETFGSNEMYEEKMSPDLVGMTAAADIPLPANVHRYYEPSTTHGGGAGGFTYTATLPPAGICTFPANPNPETQTNNALQADFIAFLTDGTPMPPNVYPTLAAGQLVKPASVAQSFPDVPGYPYGGTALNHPEKFNFGPRIDYFDESGVITNQPPLVERVLPELVPPLNKDGNETVGVPSILLQAPLATYSGWNTYAATVFKGQQCSLSGSSFPFQESKAGRIAAHDPRASLEERYGTHAGYVCVVTSAADKAVKGRFLLPADATTLEAQAQAGNVLTDLSPTAEDQAHADRLCNRVK